MTSCLSVNPTRPAVPAESECDAMNANLLSGAGLDIGGTKIAAARFDKGCIVARARAETIGQADINSQLDSMAALLQEVGHVSGTPVGAALTGRVTRNGDWMAVNRSTLSNLTGSNLKTLASDRFSGPVTLVNDAAAAALGEYRFGAGIGSNSMAYITVSTGVGGGLVLNGKLLQSDDGLAGHVGFSTALKGDQLCGSGRVGTIESLASGRAIARYGSNLAGRDVAAPEVFALWQQGTPWATSVVEQSARSIAELCANLRTILGLDRIVIGGSVGLATGYLECVSHILLNEEPELFNVDLQPAELGQDSPLFGALQFAVDQQ
ncbi:N-acylmannosamine kinase [Cohaesibacter sp. ES.047]|uniref:ROK family protein n=1 Tax=Cohaesibacter sp. ES.047 TaxID=1798205 RepID=UPI000BB95AA6|nr:ROK family protein [Cohaesibacter sp. ES.047]SNY90293.1 N-acylmannosamine kinase [Cohaesibacter sp. ES.047]